MRKLNIIHLLDDFNIGGIEKIVATLAQNSDKEKYSVSVWCVSGGGVLADMLIAKGIDVRICAIFSYYNPFAFLKLARLFKKAKPDIVHTHIYFANTIGRIAAKLAGVPVIVTHVHSAYIRLSKRNILIERLLAKITDRTICCSEAVKDFVLNYEKISPQKITTIYNGISLEPFNQPVDKTALRLSLHIKGKDIIVITVSSLTLPKAHSYFLYALHDVVQQYGNIKYLIVGDGPTRKELEDLVKLLHLESNVLFTGFRADSADLLRISDIFVLPSIREGLPLAALEAAAASLPQILTKVGGTSEIVKDGINGFLVPPGDPSALSEKLRLLIENPGLRVAMGLEGRKIIRQDFNDGIMIGKIQELYDSLVKEKHIGPATRDSVSS